jgi:hypothetical protein
MAYCKVELKGGFTVISNELMRDKRLSLKAKGLQALVLSLPPDWDTWRIYDYVDDYKLSRRLADSGQTQSGGTRMKSCSAAIFFIQVHQNACSGNCVLAYHCCQGIFQYSASCF